MSIISYIVMFYNKKATFNKNEQINVVNSDIIAQMQVAADVKE